MRSALAGRRVVVVAMALVVLAGLALAVRRANRLPDGPEPIAWDREACAFCRMHVGEPRFAAQLQTLDGQVRSYDDPGCLLADLAEKRLPVYAIWFHDHRAGSELWISGDSVAFVPLPAAEPTPMGYGLGAVPRGTPEAISMEQATRRVTHHKELEAAPEASAAPTAPVGDLVPGGAEHHHGH